jgi:NADH dehydrogenase (ubiquinone) 1 alpha subcomplex subunit 8
MGTYKDGASSSHPYKEPTPLPDSIPKVQELGVTSAPLKSAAFFLGAYCKEYNGASRAIVLFCARLMK